MVQVQFYLFKLRLKLEEILWGYYSRGGHDEKV
jgi:hypothetical protein